MTEDQAAAESQAAANGRAPKPLPWEFRRFGEFLAAGSTDPEWLIPGIIARHERGIITGDEGCGKSTLARQIAYQAAVGVHPFTGEHITPLRVALLDLENPEWLVRADLAGWHDRHPPGPGGQIRMGVRAAPEGLDILSAADDDAARLRDFVHSTGAELLVTGPIYKLAGGNENDNERAKAAVAVLDQVRAKGCALIIEAHNAKATDERRTHRPKEPIGASVWTRWPDWGVHLGSDRNEGILTHWRGARGSRQFPHRLRRGGPWPWTVDTTVRGGHLDADLGRVYRIIRQRPGISLRGIRDQADMRADDVGMLTAMLETRGLIRVDRAGNGHRHTVIREWDSQPGLDLPPRGGPLDITAGLDLTAEATGG